jgi:enoyl-CoA hydratase
MTQIAQEDRIRTEVRDRILIVTIDRPDARNAFDAATKQEMEAAMDRLDADPDLHLGIITGANGVFCAGEDLKARAAGKTWSGKRGGFGIFAKPPHKPLIAAVEGYAVGGGFELCLSCDLIVAARDAKFGLTEPRVGVLAIGGGLFRLPKRLPYHIAMELALTAEIRAAEFFHTQGMVNRLTEPGEALTGALALAEQVLRNAPLATAASKQIIARAFDWTEAESWTAQMPIADVALHSEDAKEGVDAFIGKRRPAWSGR